MPPPPFWKVCSFVLVILLWLGAMVPVQAVDVVVNATAEVSHLSRSSLLAVFSMRKTSWPNGAKIRVFVLPDDHPLHAEFCKTILGVYPHQMRRRWNKIVFSGTGQSPSVVRSLSAMMHEVATTPGAIGYIRGGATNGLVTVNHR